MSIHEDIHRTSQEKIFFISFSLFKIKICLNWKKEYLNKISLAMKGKNNKDTIHLVDLVRKIFGQFKLSKILRFYLYVMIF